MALVVHSPASLLHETLTLRESHLLAHERVVRNGRAKWLFLCHDRRYVQYVKKACECLKESEVISLRTGDVSICRHSYTAAVDAVAAAVAAVDELMNGNFKKGVCCLKTARTSFRKKFWNGVLHH